MSRFKMMRAVVSLVSILCLFSTGFILAQVISADDGPSTDRNAHTEITPDGQNILAQYSEAYELVSQRHFSRAETAIREIIEKYPNDLDSYFLLATVLIEQSNYQEASEILDMLIEKHGDNVKVLNNYAWLLATATDYSFRDPVKSLAMARDALFLNPDDYHIWSTLAEAHYVNGNFEKAVQSIEKGIELAVMANAPVDTIRNYQIQLRRLQEINASMSLIE